MKYQKRIHWDRHRPEFLKIGFVLALAVTLMAFNYTSNPPNLEPMEIEPLDNDWIITPPITIHKKKEALPLPPPSKIKSLVNIEPITEPIIKFEPKVEFKEDLNTIIDEFANDPISEPAPKVELIKIEETIDSPPLVMAERMPIYGSCDVDSEENVRRDCTSQNLLKHIYQNVKYPALAREYEIEGTVVVSFVVSNNGKVKDIEIIKEIGMGCGDEVEKAIKKLGQFLPGKQNGRPVSVIYRIPVNFKLQ